MEVTFKNTSKNQQCHEFISILKKIKFILSTKDRRVYFRIGKQQFRMSTFGNRKLEDPPSNTPSGPIVEYTFKNDMYCFSSSSQNNVFEFAFNIDDVVRAISHFFETKMLVLKLFVDDDIGEGKFEFSLADSELVGTVELRIEKISAFPIDPELESKDYIDMVEMFKVTNETEKLKDLEDLNGDHWYQLHMNGVYIKNFKNQVQISNLILEKDWLKDFNFPVLKQKLRMATNLFEVQNSMVKELKRCAKKKYLRTAVSLVIVRGIDNPDEIRHAYLVVKSHLANFPKSSKTVTTRCEIAEKIEMGQPSFLRPQPAPANLLKSEQTDFATLTNLRFRQYRSEDEYLKQYASHMLERPKQEVEYEDFKSMGIQKIKIPKENDEEEDSNYR